MALLAFTESRKTKLNEKNLKKLSPEDNVISKFQSKNYLLK